MKNYLKIFNIRSSSAGFTLIELMIAMALTTIVVSAAGFGLVTMTDNNKKAEAKTQRRIELSRALDFIADDIRMANKVEAGSSYTISPASPTCAAPNPVLHLTIPQSPSNNNIVYYFNNIITNIGSCTVTNSNSVWIKPAIIKRVQNVITTTIPGVNGSELVDAITNRDITPTCPTDLPTVSPTPDLTTGKVKGFYACTSSRNPRLVELHLIGELTDSYGNFTGTYEVKTRVFARSS